MTLLSGFSFSSLVSVICCYLRMLLPEPLPSRLCALEVDACPIWASASSLPCSLLRLLPSSFSFRVLCHLKPPTVGLLSGMFLLQAPALPLTPLALPRPAPLPFFSGQTQGIHLFLALGHLSIPWLSCFLCSDTLLWIWAASPSHRVHDLF